ncbi:hypothetical protein B0J11DRAFT_503842 [Dendryphion nanum]|uniref:Uncharacterized protein n=1 Tax=Dendryphion nanum TaxID=256645 RepID=A0A9P9E355_9PLEO|nr:hypothetical protein B0J11DRAFT_503842 [Dendryphion nanum]
MYTYTDRSHNFALAGEPKMMPVSLGPSTICQGTNDGRKSEDLVEYVQIISWNNYGESYHIGPLDDRQYDAFTVDSQLQLELAPEEISVDKLYIVALLMVSASLNVAYEGATIALRLRALWLIVGISCQTVALVGITHRFPSMADRLFRSRYNMAALFSINCLPVFSNHVVLAVQPTLMLKLCRLSGAALRREPSPLLICLVPKRSAFKVGESLRSMRSVSPLAKMVTVPLPLPKIPINLVTHISHIPITSSLLPPTCTGGAGSGNLAELCQCGCKYGFCPSNACSFAPGSLDLPPPITNLLMTWRSYKKLIDCDFCQFAYSRGKFPDVCLSSQTGLPGGVFVPTPDQIQDIVTADHFQFVAYSGDTAKDIIYNQLRQLKPTDIYSNIENLGHISVLAGGTDIGILGRAKGMFVFAIFSLANSEANIDEDLTVSVPYLLNAIEAYLNPAGIIASTLYRMFLDEAPDPCNS